MSFFILQYEISSSDNIVFSDSKNGEIEVVESLYQEDKGIVHYKAAFGVTGVHSAAGNDQVHILEWLREHAPQPARLGR